MSEYKVDTRDLEFLLHEHLKITDLQRFEALEDFDRETYDIMLSEAVKLAVDKLGPLNEVLDRTHLELKDGQVVTPEQHRETYKLFQEGGWVGSSVSAEYEGLGLPLAFDAVLGEVFSGGCMSFAMTPGLTKGAAALVIEYGTDFLKENYLEGMVSGEWGGTMCLTEPQAGSAVGDTKAVAVPVEGEDYYLFTGTKSFITSGDHDLTDNIIHLVLGRLPDGGPGVKGLSLFVIPKLRRTADDGWEPNDVACSGFEEKLGIHGSPTCTLNFGDNEDCRAWLLGEPHTGIRIMFKMMNEARLFVGIQGTSQANAAYQAALAYSQERVQGVDILKMRDVNAPRVTLINHPDIRLHLMHMRVLSEGLRALGAKAGIYADIAHHGSGKEAEKAGYCLDVLTPIVKAYTTDQAFKVCERAVQVLGGYGYCSEYGVEQYLRDVKICSIYEGTNGIQSLDLVGRKIARKGGAMFMTLLLEMNRFILRHKKHEVLGDLVKVFEKAKNTLAGVTMDFAKKGRQDMLYPVLSATDYLELFGHVALTWVVLEQASVALKGLAKLNADGADEGHPDRAFYARKVDNARFAVARILPQVTMLAGMIRSYDRSPLETTFV